jgi:hypothetical protein
MKVTILSASIPSALSHSDRVMGVLAGRHELDALARVLEGVGVGIVEVLEGAAGAASLDRQEHSFWTFLEQYFGDMEAEMSRHYAHEVGRGRLVFAVPVTRGNKDAVVEAALAHNANHVAHFGRWADESFQQPAVV